MQAGASSSGGAAGAFTGTGGHRADAAGNPGGVTFTGGNDGGFAGTTAADFLGSGGQASGAASVPGNAILRGGPFSGTGTGGDAIARAGISTTAAGTSGIFYVETAATGVGDTLLKRLAVIAAGHTQLASGLVYGWTSSATDPRGAADTGISRSSAGILAFGTGAAGSTAGGYSATTGVLATSLSCPLLTTASNADLQLGPNGTGKVVPTSNGAVSLGKASTGWSGLYLDFTNDTTAGTSGTINKASGKIRLSAGNATYTLTNSKITAASHVFAQLETSDVTATGIRRVTPGSGTVDIVTTAAATANVDISFLVVNAD